MHAAPPFALERLGHERGVHAALCGGLFHDEPVRHHVVGHRESIGESQVDLMLRRGNFVVRVFDRDAHRFEPVDGLPAEVLRHVQRRQIEIGTGIERLRRSRDSRQSRRDGRHC